MHSHIPHTVLKHHLSDGYCNPQIKNKHLSKRPSSNDKKNPGRFRIRPSGNSAVNTPQDYREASRMLTA